MAGGRPRKPRHIKEAQGTLEKSREIETPATGEPLSILPAIPDGMTADEEKYFIYCCEELLNLGLLTSQFIVSIEMAAVWYGQFCEARERVRKGEAVQTTKTGYTQTTGYWSQMKDSYKNLVEFESRYGLNLVSSQKISVPEGNRGSDFD